MYVFWIIDFFFEGMIVILDMWGDVGCNDGFFQVNVMVLFDEWDEGVGNVIIYLVVFFCGEMQVVILVGFLLFFCQRVVGDFGFEIE